MTNSDRRIAQRANTAVLFGVENIDPVSGFLLIEGRPCKLRKADKTGQRGVPA